MADKKRDYYEILGLAKSATEAEIKKAYRKLAKEHHPDLNPENKASEARFKEINEAYEVLSDSDKKAKYDQFGHAAFDPAYGAGGPGTGGFSGDFSGFGDIFSDIFGGGFGDIFGGGSRTRNGPVRGESIRVSLTISFEEAAFGVAKDILINRVEECDACHGSGSAPGTTPEVCPDCGGAGTVRAQQRTPLGVFSTTTSCPKCGGKGKIIHQPCPSCHGNGSVRKQRKVSINIPAGIDEGQTISLRGQGQMGKNGGGAGDLLVTVNIRPHPKFKRDGTSLLYSMPISFVQATLGDEIEVPTLDGKVKYTIPEGTQTGTVFRLKGKGIPYLRGNGRGDQFITVNIVVPKDLSAGQKDILRQFGAATGETPSEPKSGIFDKKKKKK